MSTANKPYSAQQPAPAFANDPSGFWASVAAGDKTAGLKSLLPASTAYQSDTAVKARLLGSQLGWTPTQARFNGADITVSLSDAQFFLALESGGTTQEGRLTVVVNKFEFRAGAFPTFRDNLLIFAGGKWHAFLVAESVGQFDDNEPALTLYLEVDQNDNGD
jgi:hypothetical protein